MVAVYGKKLASQRVSVPLRVGKSTCPGQIGMGGGTLSDYSLLIKVQGKEKHAKG